MCIRLKSCNKKCAGETDAEKRSPDAVATHFNPNKGMKIKAFVFSNILRDVFSIVLILTRKNGIVNIKAIAIYGEMW